MQACYWGKKRYYPNIAVVIYSIQMIPHQIKNGKWRWEGQASSTVVIHRNLKTFNFENHLFFLSGTLREQQGNSPFSYISQVYLNDAPPEVGKQWWFSYSHIMGMGHIQQLAEGLYPSS